VNQELTNLPVEQRAQQAIDAVGIGTIAQLAEKMESFLPVQELAITDKETYSAVSAGLAEVKATRIDITTRTKVAREDAVAFQKAVIAAEKQLLEIIKPVEESLQAKSDAWNQSEKDRKAAKRNRDANITTAISAITSIPSTLMQADSESIKEAIAALEARDIYAEGCDVFGDFVEKALEEKAIALCSMTSWLSHVIDAEEQARQFAEMKRKEEEQQSLLDRMSKQAAAQQAEIERIQREAQQAKIDAERAELEAERSRQAAESRKLKEEQDRLARESQAKADAEAKAQADKEEAASQAALRPDKEKIIATLDGMSAWLKGNMPAFDNESSQMLAEWIASQTERLVSIAKQKAAEL
jgi:DNA repair exonuclease SbcCD ATPase subunit